MTSRQLPPDEWLKLIGTELETVWPLLSADAATVFVVEDAGAIVGCWAVLHVVHVEGLHIAPAYRATGSVGRRLLTMMRAHVKGLGVKAVMTAAVTDDVRALIEKAGGRQLPGTAHLLPLGD